MIRISIAAVALLAIVGCSEQKMNAALATPPGKLFCAIQVGGGGAIIVGVVNAAVTSTVPGAGPVAVIVTGQAKATVDHWCAQAAQSVGAAAAIPVSPPASPDNAPNVAIVAAT